MVSRSQARRNWGEAYGAWYWAKRWDKPQAEIVGHILEYRKWRAIWKTTPPDTNDRGNTIWRDEDADRELHVRRGDCRYHYDFRALSTWKQYDTNQDASYFGIWVNLEKRLVFTYCEGDRTLVVCPDNAHLKAELDSMAAFYGDPPPMAIAFSQDSQTGEWTRTDYYDKRPEVT